MRRRPVLVLLILAIASMAVTPAQAAHPVYTAYELDNGLRVVLNPVRGCGVVTLGLAVRAGKDLEATPESSGLSYWTSVMMVQQTAKRKSAEEIFGPIEQSGGTLYLDPRNTYILLLGKVASADLGLISQTVSDAVQNPVFDPRFCNVVMHALGYVVKDARPTDAGSGFEKMLSGVFGDHPYAHRTIGEGKSVGETTWPGLKKLHQAYYIPNNSHLFVTGDFDPAQAQSIIARDFAGWKWRLSPARPALAKPPTGNRKFDSHAGGQQAHIFVGFRVPGIQHEDGPALAVLNAVLGQGFGSRLFQQLRSRDGLAYECYSEYDWLEYAEPSLLYMYVNTSSNKADKVTEGLLEQARQLRETGISVDELKRGQAVAIGRLFRQLQESTSQITTMAAMDAAGLGYDGFERFVARIQAVSVADVQRVAAKYLKETVVSTVKP